MASRFLVRSAHLATTYTDKFTSFLSGVPGSKVVLRYVRSSYQNDPVRSVVELALVIFLIVYMARSRFSTERSKIALTEEEIDELVAEWTPEPLVKGLTELEKMENEKRPIIAGPTGPKVKLVGGKDKVVMNLASQNFYNFNGNEALRERAVATLRKYGIGPCGPPNFYGTQDVHMQVEADIASHLGVPSCILYAQALAAISSVIPAFSKRGDIIVADKASNFSIRKGIQLSRSTVEWFEHNDMEDLERVLKKVVRESARKPLTRRFIIAEGLSENVGDMTDLPRLIQLKQKYKFRIILDETWSYGVLGATGRGITEAQHVDPSSVDMIIGSMAGALCAGGGFCAGSAEVVDHQRISSNAYTFSAALPAILATQASETVRMLKEGPELIITLRENTRIVRQQLDPKSDWVRSTSAPENPVQLLVLKDAVVEKNALGFEQQQLLLQEIVDECLAAGVMITRLKALPDVIGASAKEAGWQPRPALKVCLTTGLTRKELERAGITIRHAVTKVMGRLRK